MPEEDAGPGGTTLEDAKDEELHLPYEIGYLTELMKQVAEKELKETDQRREASLQKLRQLIAEEKNFFVRTDDNFLLQFLRARKFDVSMAFKTLRNYYKFRKKHSQIYNNTCNAAVHDVFRKNFVGFLPYRDKGKSVILLVKIGMWDPDEICRDLLLWTATHCIIHSIEDPATQVMGYSVIFDLRNVGSKHFRQLTLENIMLVLNSVQFCFPGRIKSVHIVGMPAIFSAIWSLLYPFIFNSKLRRKIHIHGDNLEDLHEHFSPEILPSECGGLLGPFDNSAWHASILAKNDWCLEQRLYGYQN